MDNIFRKELKVDDSVADMSLADELDDCTPEPGQKKGEIKFIAFLVVIIL